VTWMKAGLTAAVMSTIIVGFCIAPVMAQDLTVHYVVYVDFFHTYCNLSDVQVTVDDQLGHVVATGYSPDGSEIAIVYQTTTHPNFLTVRASGLESLGPYFWLTKGISIVNLGADSNYWVWVKML